MGRLLIIDNYDSFTWNLYQYFSEMGEKVFVRRNDTITIKDIQYLNPSTLVISPGPGNPNNSGISLSVVRYFAGKIPILGICLGHQVIGQVFGANIICSQKVMHGKISSIFHNNKSIFYGLPKCFKVVRYHSLIIDQKELPDCLNVIAWSIQKHEKKEIMAIQHKDFSSLIGVQFHPESIMSENGFQLLKNFLHEKYK